MNGDEKDSGSKVFVSAANAPAARTEMTATVAKSTERREYIVEVLLVRWR